MKDDFVLPPRQAILDQHAELLAAHGGSPGLRDLGGLEAALARPGQILAYDDGHVTVFDLAAALCVGICRHRHPFVNGNKRAAFAALGMTLGMNGLYLDATERAAFDMVKSVADGKMSEQSFRDWVASNSFELPDLNLDK